MLDFSVCIDSNVEETDLKISPLHGARVHQRSLLPGTKNLRLSFQHQISCTREHLHKIHSAVLISAGNMQNYLPIVAAGQVGQPFQALDADKHFPSEPTFLQSHGIDLRLRDVDFFHIALEQIQHGVLHHKFEDELC